VSEITKLRAQQAIRVMPLIGPLLDAADALPNDLRDPDGELSDLLDAISHIHRAMEGSDDPDSSSSAEAQREKP
jgi:hypothetical protein